ncbi:hypothetical protein HJ114_05400 [Vibrio parahaemolyticus]|nr:hypothetical protein [Vibrio parahaemolyticus]MBE4224262.1 hypothetical protein [Vibrio parahaemolyticus]
MTNKCGQCRQFTRVKSSDQDICGAWGHPTCATRIACEFFYAYDFSKTACPDKSRTQKLRL